MVRTSRSREVQLRVRTTAHEGSVQFADTERFGYEYSERVHSRGLNATRFR